jgi:hypothetical protein
MGYFASNCATVYQDIRIVIEVGICAKNFLKFAILFLILPLQLPIAIWGREQNGDFWRQRNQMARYDTLAITERQERGAQPPPSALLIPPFLILKRSESHVSKSDGLLSTTKFESIRYMIYTI